MFKEGANLIFLKQHSNGTVVKKQKTLIDLQPNVDYAVQVAFDGSQFKVTVDGVEKIVMTPVGKPPTGVPAFRVKNTVGTFGPVCVQ